MIDVVVIRDPDASNEIRIFGTDDVVEVDIDLGRMDLSNADEFYDWVEGHRANTKRVRHVDAWITIRQAVRDAAEAFGHKLDPWWTG
jgi:hypothetical protein